MPEIAEKTEKKRIEVAFFDAKPYDVSSFSPYAEKGDLHFRFFDTKLTIETVGLAEGADAVCVFVNDSVDAAVIDALCAMGVRLVALRCAGYNNVDLGAAFGKIHVIHVPAYSPNAVAEHAMALLLTSVRRIHKAYNRTREFNFALKDLVGFNLCGKTVGVVGTGKIGRAFIRICLGFEMKVLAYDKFPAAIDGVEFVDLDRLFAESDVISLHCPLTDETHHMICRESIEKMKRGVVIVNTSRGGLIDAEALLAGVKARKIGAACLDVYEEESDIFFEDNSGHILDDDTLARLISMPNLLITSHQGFLTTDALSAIAETTANGIRAFFAGDPPENEICYRCEKFAQCKQNKMEKCF